MTTTNLLDMNFTSQNEFVELSYITFSNQINMPKVLTTKCFVNLRDISKISVYRYVNFTYDNESSTFGNLTNLVGTCIVLKS